MPIEHDDQGIRIIGYEPLISWYNDARELQAQIYLQPDGTLNVGGLYGGGGGEGGGATGVHGLGDLSIHTGALASAQAPQFLLLDGSRPMAGNLNVGGHDIANVGTVDGVDVSGHAARHESGGADAVDHDSLSGFVVNEHIDHSDVSITAGVGLIGGGTIAESRTLDHHAGDFGDLHTNYAEHAANETITGLWDFRNDVKFGGDQDTFIYVDSSEGTLGTSDFVSGLRGWRLDRHYAEFNNLVARGEFHSSVFVYDEIHAGGGSLLVAESSVLLNDATTPAAVGSAFALDVKDPPSGHVQLFDAGDVLRMRYFEGASLVDVWGSVSSVTDNTTHFTYTLALESGSTDATLPEGLAVISYGQLGDGRILLTSDQAHAPYLDIFETGPTPWLYLTPRVRLGKLDGITTAAFGTLSGYGLWADKVYLEGDGAIAGDLLVDGSVTADKLWANVLTLGDGGGVVLDDAVLHLPFDGPRPYERDFQVNTTGHLGQVATVSGGVIGRPGKFGKAVQCAEGTTNLVPNPVMRTLWGGYGSPVVRELSTDWIKFDAYSLHVAGDSGGDGAATFLGSLTSGVTYTYSAHCKAVTTVYLRVVKAGSPYTTYADMVFPAGEESFRVTTFTMPETASCNLVFFVGSGEGYLDGVQLEQKPYPTPFAYGDMPGHSWTGTPHASTTERLNAALYFEREADEIITAAEGTVAMWFKVTKPSTYHPTDGTDNDALWECNYSNGALLAIRYVAAASTLDLYGLASDTLRSAEDVIETGTWYHAAFTWQKGGGVYLYLNGQLQDSGDCRSDLDFGSGNMMIGAWSGSYQLNGWIDDFAILERALTADEVRAVYESNRPVTVTTSPMQLLLTGENAGIVYGNTSGLFAQQADGAWSWALLNDDLTVGSGAESRFAGDVLLGDNGSGQANILWDRNAGKFFFRGGTTPQVEIGTDGGLKADGENLKLDAGGITLASLTDYAPGAAIKFGTGQIWGRSSFSVGNNLYIQLGPYDASLAAIRMTNSASGLGMHFVLSTAITPRQFGFTNADVAMSHDARIGGGLYVGSTGTDPDDDDIHYDGNLKSVKGGSTYDVYGFHPLTTPITHGSFNGQGRSTTGTSTKIENTSWSSTIPAEAKALLLQIVAADSGAGDNYFTVGPSATYYFASTARPTQGGDLPDENTGAVPCTDGDIYYRCKASGSSTLDVWLRVWGYWI